MIETEAMMLDMWVRAKRASSPDGWVTVPEVGSTVFYVFLSANSFRIEAVIEHCGVRFVATLSTPSCFIPGTDIFRMGGFREGIVHEGPIFGELIQFDSLKSAKEAVTTALQKRIAQGKL